MKSTLRPTRPEDEPRLRELLVRAFGARGDEPFVDPALLHWKYWGSREDQPGPRSLALEKGGVLRAHAGLWTVTVPSSSGPLTGLQMIDWGADPKHPGAGLSILQRIAKQYDFVYSIGGSEHTRAAMPGFGFREVAEATTFARPLRPWRQILRHQRRDLRLPARLARNLWWASTPRLEPDPGWTIEPVEGDALGDPPGERSAGFFAYLRRCPTLQLTTYELAHKGRRAGLLALAVIGLRVGVAGVWWRNGAGVEEWARAYRLAQRAALRDTAACEIVARIGGEAGSAGAGPAGLRPRRTVPVFVYRRDGSPEPLSLYFQLCDDDACFLPSYTAGFLT